MISLKRAGVKLEEYTSNKHLCWNKSMLVTLFGRNSAQSGAPDAKEAVACTC